MRLYLLELGRISTGEPILGYLVLTGDGKTVVIDTGYRPGSLGEEAGGEPAFLQASPEQLVLNQLCRMGISPEDVDYVTSHTSILTTRVSRDHFPVPK